MDQFWKQRLYHFKVFKLPLILFKVLIALEIQLDVRQKKWKWFHLKSDFLKRKQKMDLDQSATNKAAKVSLSKPLLTNIIFILNYITEWSPLLVIWAYKLYHVGCREQPFLHNKRHSAFLGAFSAHSCMHVQTSSIKMQFKIIYSIQSAFVTLHLPTHYNPVWTAAG